MIDDSLMLLRFVDEDAAEANYQVTTAPTRADGLRAAKTDGPDLILLDYVLPDMKGDEVSRRLLEDPATAEFQWFSCQVSAPILHPEQSQPKCDWILE